jgi:hypothetical protein
MLGCPGTRGLEISPEFRADIKEFVRTLLIVAQGCLSSLGDGDVQETYLMGAVGSCSVVEASPVPY